MSMGDSNCYSKVDDIVMKKATNVEEQIKLLRDRGMCIADEEKAKEVLLDIGYYRLGFYWFPFECTYPSRKRRTHQLRQGTRFDSIVRLYYFDFNLRNILTKYLNRIEIHLRTFVTYHVSNQYRDSPTWFVDPSVVHMSFIKRFDREVYTPRFKCATAILHHHKTHINDKYAPAWKTLEFMTLGGIIRLFNEIRDDKVRRVVSQHFRVMQLSTFESYLSAILTIRNYCAHGNVLYDISLPTSIRKGPAGRMNSEDYHKLHGAIKVIYYFVGVISVHRQLDLRRELTELFATTQGDDEVAHTIAEASGINCIHDIFV